MASMPGLPYCQQIDLLDPFTPEIMAEFFMVFEHCPSEPLDFLPGVCLLTQL